jgi:hypothetical protein
MKKKLITIAVIVLFIGSIANSDIQDYWGPGWISSTGETSEDWIASNVQIIPEGYSFKCSGTGVCYTINGPWLDIYEGGAGPNPFDVDIFRK